jgi:hypothetical protein
MNSDKCWRRADLAPSLLLLTTGLLTLALPAAVAWRQGWPALVPWLPGFAVGPVLLAVGANGLYRSLRAGR